MAIVSNVNRKAAAKTLVEHVALLGKVAGLVIQTHRAYESPQRGGRGLTQQAVANAANVQQPTMSKLENGSVIPGDPALSHVLQAAGFNMAAGGGGAALLALLQAIRDNQGGLKQIINEKPA